MSTLGHLQDRVAQLLAEGFGTTNEVIEKLNAGCGRSFGPLRARCDGLGARAFPGASSLSVFGGDRLLSNALPAVTSNASSGKYTLDGFSFLSFNRRVAEVYSGGKIVFTNCYIFNSQPIEGSAIQVNAHGAVSFESTNVTNNRADYGGAVFCQGTCTVTKHSIFKGNEANVQGGALYCRGAQSKCVSQDSKFENSSCFSSCF